MKRWTLWLILAIVAIIGLALSLAAEYWACDGWGWLTNLGPELIGAAVTYALFELFIGQRQHIEAEKKQLIEEMGSSVNDVAVAAVDKLRKRGWLRDGSLNGADLRAADLGAADLSAADLKAVDMYSANLREANLWGADLSGADLSNVYLQMAKLIEANLERVELRGASLGKAILWEANLGGADLRGADLREANLEGAKFDEETTLPDGTQWTPDINIVRLTDPEHSDFFHPLTLVSVRYSGEKGAS